MDSGIPPAPVDPTLLKDGPNIVENLVLGAWVQDIVDGVVGGWYDGTDASNVLLNFASSMKGIKNLSQAHTSYFIKNTLCYYNDKSPDLDNKFWKILNSPPPPF